MWVVSRDFSLSYLFYRSPSVGTDTRTKTRKYSVPEFRPLCLKGKAEFDRVSPTRNFCLRNRSQRVVEVSTYVLVLKRPIRVLGYHGGLRNSGATGWHPGSPGNRVRTEDVYLQFSSGPFIIRYVPGRQTFIKTGLHTIGCF